MLNLLRFCLQDLCTFIAWLKKISYVLVCKNKVAAETSLQQQKKVKNGEEQTPCELNYIQGIYVLMYFGHSLPTHLVQFEFECIHHLNNILLYDMIYCHPSPKKVPNSLLGSSCY